MQWTLDRIGHVHDVWTDELWSPVRLRDEVARRAAVLRGLCRGDTNRFVIAHANSPSFLADLFAVWRVGGSAACVSPTLTAGELAKVTEFVEARAVLVRDTAPSLAGVPLVDAASEAARALTLPARLAVPAAGRADDEALILFTSGTTGDPKGVVHTHGSLQARVALNRAEIGDETLARTLCVLPTHFGHGLIGNCLTPLLAGGDLHLMVGTGVAGAQQLGAVVQRHGIRFMSSVPAFWNLALRGAPPPPGVLRRVHIGSAPLSALLWQRVVGWCGTAAVGNLYGTTETANWIGGVLASEMPPEDGLVGKAWGGSLAVLDDAGRVHASGETEAEAEAEGEVLVQTPSMMRGYLNRPDLTAAVLHDGWYRTGDRGRLDAQGVLRLTGRERSMINRAGIKVYPEELDLLFERHPLVAEACAFGVPDAVAGESVGLAVRLVEGAAVSGRELTAWARQHIRAEAVPARIHVLAELPRNERGKINRAGVARQCLAPANAADELAAHPPTAHVSR